MWRKRKPPAWLRLRTEDWCSLTACVSMFTYVLGWGTLRFMGWLPPPEPSPPLIITDARPYAVIFGMATVYGIWLAIRLGLYAVLYADDIDREVEIDDE
jgi:hypothetical protein